MQKEINRLLRHLSQEKLKKNHKECIELCNMIGGVYSENGCYNEALSYHEDALDIATKIGNILATAVAQRLLGECKASLGQFQEALGHTKNYLDLANKSGDKIEVQRAWTTLGRVYLMQSQELRDNSPNVPNPRIQTIAKTAEQHFMKAMRLAEGLRDRLDKTEFAQMQSGLLLNLGLIKDICNQYTEAIMKLHSANEICKNAKLREELFRIQLVSTSIHRQKGNLKYAVKTSEETCATAKSIGKKLLICEALLEKGQVKLLQNDFKAAKRTFAQAYLEKSPNEEDHLKAIKMTKLAHLLFITQEKVTSGKLSSQDELIRLYDKQGDLFTELSMFKKAIDCYKRALTTAKAASKNKNELSRLLFSIAETYADDGQFQNAISYYNQELACRNGKCSEQCQTLLKIAHMMEYQNADVTLIADAYERAYEKATDNHKLLYQVLKDYVPLLKKNSYNLSRCHELDNILLNLRSYPEIINACALEDDVVDDEEDLDDEITNIDDIISITSDNENAEDEECPSAGGKRNMRGGKKFKANELGETPLHEASIKGDMKRVKTLVENGHDLNVRDNFGWTPLHEACNNGHYEVVEYLIDSGADVRDRGPRGVSPLHDAAANGHWHIMRLLMKNGANVISLTDKGETVLACLREFKKTKANEMTNDEMYECRQMESELLNAMDKYGFNIMEDNVRNIAASSVGTSSADDPFEITAASVVPRSATQEYKNVISTLKRRPTSDACQQPLAKRSSSSQLPSLVETTENTSAPTKEWLIDDVSRVQRIKNRRTMLETLLSSGDELADEEQEEICIRKPATKAKRKVVCIESDDDDDEIKLTNVVLGSASIFDDESKFSEEEATRMSALARQTRTFDITSTPAPDPTPTFCDEPIQLDDDITQLSNFSEAASNSTGGGSRRRALVAVLVEEQRMLIPLFRPNGLGATTGWLRGEVARRHTSLAGAEPELRLTLVGDSSCALGDDDNVVDIITDSGGGDLLAEVIGWKLAPAVDIYLTACTNSNVEPDECVASELRRSMINKLDLAHCLVQRAQVAPILQALSRRSFDEATFRGSPAFAEDDECANHLVRTISTLAKLSVLDLKCIGLRAKHFKSLCLAPLKCTQLLELDISSNLIVFEHRGEFIKTLEAFHCKCPKLRKLSIDGNEFRFATSDEACADLRNECKRLWPSLTRFELTAASQNKYSAA